MQQTLRNAVEGATIAKSYYSKLYWQQSIDTYTNTVSKVLFCFLRFKLKVFFVF